MRGENLAPDSGHGRADAALSGAETVTTRTSGTPECAHRVPRDPRPLAPPGARSLPHAFERAVSPCRGSTRVSTHVTS